MELTEKAKSYAEGKANEAITYAISQAYIDGYRDGYKDREEEIPVDLRCNETEYVDLGLPSGTLWSADYEKLNSELIYLPYCEAVKYQIPTEEQFKELMQFCKFYIDTKVGHICIGPNGNRIVFNRVGWWDNNFREGNNWWLKDTNDSVQKSATDLIYDTWQNARLRISSLFSGYRLPIRLVRSK